MSSLYTQWIIQCSGTQKIYSELMTTKGRKNKNKVAEKQPTIRKSLEYSCADREGQIEETQL